MKRLRNSILFALLALVANSVLAYDFMQDGIFYNIVSNQTVTVTYKSLYDVNNYKGNVAIPATVSHLGVNYNVVAIDNNAFNGCVAIKQVSIPNSVTYIGSQAFDGCVGLTSISIPASVNEIGTYAFSNCINLETITVASGNSTYDSRNNCNAIIEKSSNKLIVGCLGTTIPASVSVIGKYAFYGVVKKEQIIIPNSVTDIETFAFQDCLSASSLSLGSSLKVIGQQAFQKNEKLTQLTIPDAVTTIENGAFLYCYHLANINLGNGVKKIGGAAFQDCNSLTSITIPASVTEILEQPFINCPNLESIVVADDNAKFDSRNNCNAIINKATKRLISGCRNTVIPESVLELGNYCFEGSSVASVSIPAYVKKIGSSAFYNCNELTNVYTRITKFSELEANGIFAGKYLNNCILHVPSGTKHIYGAMDNWNNFADIVEDLPEIGDANGDHTVNVSDITTLINMLLGRIPKDYDLGDVNHDGELNVSDVTALINILLAGDEDYDAEFGLYQLNHIYQSMYTAGWTTGGNTHQCFGISAYNLMAEVMGDDMIMAASGSGWFWYDAIYDVKSLFTRTTWRPYDLWNAYYTWIGKANSIINLMGTPHSVSGKYALGQAYAIRAYSYFMLAQSFARTYKGHESEPCVPIYTGTQFEMNTGAPRATVAQVYQQIDNDITQALQLLKGISQRNPIHMSIGVARGLQSRIALVKEDWNTALTAAEAAITACGKTIADVPSFMGLNNASAPNVMWGAPIDAEHSGYYASLFPHMSQNGQYGKGAPKQISLSLYNKMSTTDARRAWWDTNAQSTLSYYGGIQQVKFEFSDASLMLGDYIWMRVEEMYLNAAEAACRLSNEAKAKQYLTQLMAKRDPNYTCNKTGKTLGALTSDVTGSLLEEIITQRRIELWGEAGRVYDIRRLKQGFTRNRADGWNSGALLQGRPTTNTENYMWVMTIPQTEFDNNPYLDVNTNQNPLDDQ